MKPDDRSNRKFGLFANNKGLTLVELISVLVLISIIATVVLSRTMDNSVELIGEIEIVKGHLRFAQIRAMNSNQNWGLNFSGSSYSLMEGDSTGTTALPGESGPIRNLEVGTVTGPAGPITFNQWGSLSNTDNTVTITDGVNSLSFSITPFTGFIP